MSMTPCGSNKSHNIQRNRSHEISWVAADCGPRTWAHASQPALSTGLRRCRVRTSWRWAPGAVAVPASSDGGAGVPARAIRALAQLHHVALLHLPCGDCQQMARDGSHDALVLV